MWPAGARDVHAMHLFGVEALMALPGEALEAFFAAFFTLPPQAWQAYLSRTAGLPEVVRLMLTLFARAPGGVRLPFARAGLRDAGLVLRALRHA
ncbi:lycopene cyclase family protein, partial [Deinococcus pimensis]|uniref:lycopene cyclase family protein n=1 Tax=Deinococcus pimensis TaxID=309888 RepID=UPI0005EB5F06